MNEDQEKEYIKLKKQKEKQLKRQNKYAAENYDRIAFVAKKGYRDIIREYYTEKGYTSLADYFISLAKKDGCPIDYISPSNSDREQKAAAILENLKSQPIEQEPLFF